MNANAVVAMNSGEKWVVETDTPNAEANQRTAWSKLRIRMRKGRFDVLQKKKV